MKERDFMPGPSSADHRDDEQVRANRAAWTEPGFIDAWQRWSPQLRTLLGQATEHMLRVGRPAPGMHILDLACGTGEPALSLARRAAPGGQVIASDLGPDILDIARKNAAAAGIENILFEQADAHGLPFARESFDLVTCRFGAMYFSDIARALGEIAAVLRPAGRAVFVVWGPEEQPYFRHTRSILRRHAGIKTDPSSPDAFVFSRPGSLSAVLRDAGFARVSEEALDIDLVWPGTAETLWQFYQDSTTGMAALRRTLADRWESITQEVLESLYPYQREKNLILPGAIHIAWGDKPARVAARSGHDHDDA